MTSAGPGRDAGIIRLYISLRLLAGFADTCVFGCFFWKPSEKLHMSCSHSWPRRESSKLEMCRSPADAKLHDPQGLLIVVVCIHGYHVKVLLRGWSGAASE